jgi:hypothetical protein
MQKPANLNQYTFISEKTKDISDLNLISQFRDCSFKNLGCIYKTFLELKNSPNSKVVYCLLDNQVVGWGLLSKESGKYSIMLYVRKNHRRLGIGSHIFKKLSLGLPIKQISYWPHDKKSREFFKKNTSPKNKMALSKISKYPKQVVITRKHPLLNFGQIVDVEAYNSITEELYVSPEGQKGEISVMYFEVFPLDCFCQYNWLNDAVKYASEI